MPSEEDEDEIPSETETEKELMDDFFEKISLNDHSPLEIDKICLHADNIKVMSPTKITKVRLSPKMVSIEIPYYGPY